MVKVRVHLRDTRDGLTGIVEHEFDDLVGLDYLYRDGNYACDCNRSYFLFRDALQLPDWQERKLECGDKTILIDKVETLDGRVIYADDP